MNPVLKTALKIFQWLIFIVLGIYSLFALYIETFDRYIATDKGALWYYSDIPNADALEVKRTPSGVRYLSLGDPNQQALLLIHGAPGSIMDFKAFCRSETLQKKYRLLVVERPGYGGTKPRRAEPSIKIQAERIAEILDAETQAAIILGHSYGGPLAVLQGAIKPEKIEKIIGVSGAYDPDNEVTMEISHYINFSIYAYMMPRLLWASNVEKLSHPDGLREIVPMYRQVTVPVVLIHGDADTLVPYENTPWLLELLPNAELIRLAGKEHPVHMTFTQYFVDYLLNL